MQIPGAPNSATSAKCCCRLRWVQLTRAFRSRRQITKKIPGAGSRKLLRACRCRESEQNQKFRRQYMHSTTKWPGRIPWLLIPVLLLSCTIAQAQNITATLSRIATDQTDARIPGAKVLVKNEASGDQRDTKSDNDGFWSVTALIPGSYT